jgi:hypothetical protein
MKKIKKILVECILDGLSRWELLLYKLGIDIRILSEYSSHLINLCSKGRLTNNLTNKTTLFSVRNSGETQKNILKILKEKKTQLRKLLIDIGIFSEYALHFIKLSSKGRLKKNTLYIAALGTTMHIINRGIVPNRKRLQAINTAICILFLL